MSATSSSRPCWLPALTTGRRSSVKKSSASSSAMSAQSRAAKHDRNRSLVGLQRFPAAAPAAAVPRSARARRRGLPRRRFRSGYQVAFDGQKLDHSPLGVEALRRGPMRRKGDDRSETAEPMHSLDVDPDVRHKVPRGADVRGLDHSASIVTSSRWSMMTQSGVVARKFVPVERSVAMR